MMCQGNFHSVHWCNRYYKSHSNLLKQYQCNWCHKNPIVNVKCQMSDVKCQLSNVKLKMSNVNRLNLLLERTFRFSPVIILLTQKLYDIFPNIWALCCMQLMHDQHGRAHIEQCKTGCKAVCHSLLLLEMCSYYCSNIT